MISLLLSIVLIQNAFSQDSATAYRPYEFNDVSLHQRKDIHDVDKSLYVKLKNDVATTTVKREHIQIHLFPELANWVEKVKPNYTPLKRDGRYVSNCPATANFNLNSYFARPDSCFELRSMLAGLLSGSPDACLSYWEPEYFFRDYKGIPDPEKLDTLNDAILIAGNALSRLDLPSEVLDKYFVRMGRDVLVKIRYPKIAAKLSERLNLLEEVNRALLTQNSCATTEIRSEDFINDIQKMRRELIRTQEELSALISLGTNQSAIEQRELTALGKQRVDLPYPYLTNAERQFLSMWVGAVYWRIRGGGLLKKSRGTQETRYLYAYKIFKMLAELNGTSLSEKIASAMLYRLSVKGWGEWFNIGGPGTRKDIPYDLTMMTWRGQFQVGNSTSILDLAGFDSTEFSMGGLMMGPCYYLGRFDLEKTKIGFRMNGPHFSSFVGLSQQWGEVCTGAALGLGLSKTLLNGY